MKSVKFPRKFKVYAPLLAVFLVLTIIVPKTPKFAYDYKKGSPWMYETLVAQFDFPILKTDLQIQQDVDRAWDMVIPYYRYSQAESMQFERNLGELSLGKFDSLKTSIATFAASLYERGIILLDSDQENSNSDVIYIQRDRRAQKIPMSEVYTVDSALESLRASVEAYLPGVDVDSLFSASKLASLIVPNLIFDKQSTSQVHSNTIEYISTTQGVVRAGQTVVNKGEIVTDEIEQVLDSYKSEYNNSIGYDGGAYQWISAILISLALVVVLFLAIYYCNRNIFEQYNKYLYLLIVFTLSSLAAAAIGRNSTAFYYMVPFTLVSLYLLAFFKQRVVFTVYVISLLPVLLFAPNGIEIFVIYLVAGVVGMLVFEYFNRGWLQFVTALIVFVVMALMWIAFRLGEGLDTLSEYPIVLHMAVGAFLSVAGYPLIYLFEKIFKLVSKSKLIDLCDTSNKLLRELADKAPGTFQHSLQVMNLADAAARSIDADVPLIRAGALYHDIGKMVNPACFTENAAPGVNYHEGLSYKESAHDIISHVSNGMELADKYGIPSVIKDFILTHHGTSCTGYFYNKYLNEGGSPDDVADFFYNGRKPVTKEQVILMLCDSVEAASRSLKDYSEESISALVERIYEGKNNDGQFSEAEISLSELNVVKSVIKSHIRQMYHARVAYPKRVARAKA